jgi:hypothetical protein
MNPDSTAEVHIHQRVGFIHVASATLNEVAGKLSGLIGTNSEARDRVCTLTGVHKDTTLAGQKNIADPWVIGNVP